MSFSPIAPGFSQSLLGVATTPRIAKMRDDTLYRKRIRGDAKESSNNGHVIVLIVISAIVFVTVVSIYDVIRNSINNKYAILALENPEAENSPKEIKSTVIANDEALNASVIFSVVCIITSVVLFMLLSR